MRAKNLAPIQSRILAAVVTWFCAAHTVLAETEDQRSVRLEHSDLAKFINDYCLNCHNAEKQKGKLNLESALESSLNNQLSVWKDVLQVLEEREMPPEDEPDVPRPTAEEYRTTTAQLLTTLPQNTTVTHAELQIDNPSQLLAEYCIGCHNPDDRKGDLDLAAIQNEPLVAHTETWERVVRRLESRQMPPPDRSRPTEQVYLDVTEKLVTQLDAYAANHPRPGRIETFRRLNRTEYQNAIRDLLGVQVNASDLLPQDEESFGFDNVTVGTLSPSLLDRYISAAQKISRLAIGRKSNQPGGHTFRAPGDYTQEKHVAGLPLGTRGGMLVDYTFPQDGYYEITVRLTRDRNEHVEGMSGEHEMEILVDRKPIERFTVTRKGGIRHSDVDKHLKTRTFIKAGPRKVGVTFLAQSHSLLENKRRPFEASFNLHRHPRRSPAVYQFSITGPFEAQGARETPSRSKIFIDYPETPEQEGPVARLVIERLMQQAFRRNVTDVDLEKPLRFYRASAETHGFEAGIESALTSILVSPEFLFRVEREPTDVAPGHPYSISDLELASRIAFFIWSSVPDEELLEAAIENRLRHPGELNHQVNRMLLDPRSINLVNNFAGQWLHLRNLEAITPDLRLFPDFDDNLRQSFRHETELFIQSVFQEDRSLLELIKSNYTFLNERLAHHYEIPGIIGSRFRRVSLEPKTHRGGLLRQGSILTVTSYATRTSPVIRGNWILENILGTPPPPPPPDVPALEDNKVDASLSMRERLASHRANPACASCHDLMDPVGFALENFDAVGRWREFENGSAIDVSGGLPDGSEFAGVVDLENGLLNRPELFVGTFTEKLLTFALGRGLESHDAPAIRQIVREAKANDFRFSSVVLGITKSVPFQMRTKSEVENVAQQ